MPARPPVVVAFAERIQDLLGDRLVAIYLGGSWSMGDFVEGASDFDLLVVVADELSATDLASVASLHEALLAERPDAARLDGDYVPRDWLESTGTSRPVPFFRHGRLQPRPEMMLSADNIANVRRDGVRILGPRPAELLPEVTEDEVRAAVRAMIADEPQVATEREAAEEILNLVRSLFAIETGHPATKSDGARWALEHLDARWHAFALRADDIRRAAPVDENTHDMRRALADMRAALRLA